MDGVATTYDMNGATVLAALRRVHHPSGDLRLRDINFQVRRGELFGIVGPRGSGKSSLLRLLAGLEQPADGEVDLFNVRSNGRPGKKPHPSQVGFVPRDETFDSRDIVGELVDVSAREFGIDDDALREVRVRDSLAQTRLLEAAEWPVGRLSIGMQRRLSIACVLVRRPEMIVLDEPLHDVEHVLRDPIWTIIDRLRSVRATVVIATEDLSLADRFDRILVLSNGGAVALGGPTSIRRDLFGGDVLCLRIDGLDRTLTSKLLNLPYVLRGIRLDDETVEVIVADRNRDLNRLRRMLGRVHNRDFVIEPYDVSFERVFYALAS